MQPEPTPISDSSEADTDEIARLTARIERLERTQGKEVAALREAIAKFAAMSISIDVASVLTLVWPLADRTMYADSATGSQHGHAILMQTIVAGEVKKPGTLRGRSLVEIGTTREPVPTQKSTQKLAFFAALTGLEFTTVDMDSANTEAVKNILSLVAPSAKAVTDKGETFLEACENFPDFVYLDAFDYDHEHHSDRRRSRYRDILDSDINDEACWEMHLRCAETIFRRMPSGGLVGFDDTWINDDGEYDGKGRLGVPFLIEKGFSVVRSSDSAVVLMRNIGNGDF